MNQRVVEIGAKPVGEGYPVYIIFEAGQTHQGLESCKQLVDVAAEARADAIKFQIFDPLRLVPCADIVDEYEILVDKKTGQTELVQEPLIESFKRHALCLEEWHEVKRHADNRGINFFATVAFPEDVDFLSKIGINVFKICSADLNHHPFIRYVAEKNLPIMIDTGSSTIGEVEKTVDIIRSTGNDQIIINHCPSGHPARIDSVNLRVIKTLKAMFPYPIAFSDHNPGWDMDIAAVALGAHIIEKTITTDRTIKEAEHIESVEVEDAYKMVQAIRDLEKALGLPRILKENVAVKQRVIRRSIYVVKDMAQHQELTWDCIDFRRPGRGLSPELLEVLLGKKLKRAITANTMLTWEDFI